jgi:hypothetical protein
MTMTSLPRRGRNIAAEHGHHHSDHAHDHSGHDDAYGCGEDVLGSNSGVRICDDAGSFWLGAGSALVMGLGTAGPPVRHGDR